MDALSRSHPQSTGSTNVDEAEQALIKDLLVAHLMAKVPAANPRPMYGGTVLELEADNPKSRIGEVHGYRNDVSPKFAQRAFRSDKSSVLVRAGKCRRHNKFFGR